MKNIFVGNLDFITTEDKLLELFQAHGTVGTVTVVKDRDTGISRGFAFVEMGDDAEADTAIHALNGTLLDNRQLTINEARPKRENEVERRRQSRDPLPTRQHRQHRY